MATKHEQIIQYIQNLPIDSKISVRSIARNLKVSEGTAYRAIKSAENLHLVATKERVGTVRIEENENRRMHHLTIEEIIKVTDCQVLGGASGLSRQVRKFIIGAMEADGMRRYIEPDSLIIVGNRDEIQRIALENDVAVLISGGFKPSETIVDLANKREVPLLSVNFDTYATATLINKAMIERSMQKDILLVEDIYIPLEQTQFLYTDDTITAYRQLSENSGHTRFPICERDGKLAGILTAKDILDFTPDTHLAKAMTPTPISAKKPMSVASITHMMIWDGLEILPVVDEADNLQGILSRQDVLRTLQYTQQTEQSENRIEVLLADKLKFVDQNEDMTKARYRFLSDVSLTNDFGALSNALQHSIIQLSVKQFVKKMQDKSIVVDKVNAYYLKLVPLQSTIDIVLEFLDVSRRTMEIDITVYHGKQVMTKAMASVKTLTN
ncbi:CBS domain-containing protein [Aerococcus urinaeequi]|uniref:DRTGG domain-containing protein n=1 Tax=Aerococcus urinaeequi TaxID=51665 RepID=A0AA47J2W3_9LACT|nr:DRTGG domain-containing protein [Aerococcus urinaeequi]MCY7730625.1 CBS domain-containing protein [Aerococcus urinaeequi]WAT23877.1 DRTGG domain-containing protein [Aerococcus urinaeequi]